MMMMMMMMIMPMKNKRVNSNASWRDFCLLFPGLRRSIQPAHMISSVSSYGKIARGELRSIGIVVLL
jgi:hypothetical protein